MKRGCQVGLIMLCGFCIPSFAIVMPLPPVPPESGAEVPSTAEGSTALAGSKNSQKTQTLIDQLFTKADYKEFAEQTPAELTFGANP